MTKSKQVMVGDSFSISLDVGLDIIVYRSKIEPGRFVVEIDTYDDPEAETQGWVRHDSNGVPQIKVMINEGIVSNEGGFEPITKDPE